MQPAVMLGLFSLRGGEIMLVLAAVLILYGAKKLPDLAKGLRRGICRFRDSMGDLVHDAGRSVGGIYGKPAAQALTPDNQIAELYDPAALRRRPEKPTLRKRALQLLKTICLSIRSWFIRR